MAPSDPTPVPPRDVSYKGFVIHARPLPLKSGTWSTQIQIQRLSAFKPFYSSYEWTSETEAILGSLEFGRRIIDGEIPGIGLTDLP